MQKLTAKQKAFVKEYLVDLNATQAAIRAGYSERTAKETGYENLTKPHIAAAIEKAMEKRADKVEITQERVLEELSYIAFNDTTDVVQIETTIEMNPITEQEEPYQTVIIRNTSELTKAQRRAIKSIKQTKYGIEVQFHDKEKALELLGRHMKMFTDKVESEVTGDIQVTLNVPMPKTQ